MASFKVKNGIEASTVLERLNSPAGVTQNGLAAPSVTGSALTTALNLQYYGMGYKFKPDGTRFWHSDPTSLSVFYQYDLSTAWDLSTAGTPSTASPTSQRTLRCFVFKTDGTKLYIPRDYSTNVILEYDVATAWDITSAHTLVNTLTVTTELPDSQLYNLHLSSDGTKMICIGDSNYAEYTLSTAWDISTATVANTGTTGTARAYSFTDDGTEAHYVEGQDIYKATLSTAWDTTTLSSFTKQGSFSSAVATPRTFYKKDATTGFILDGSAASSFKEIDTTYSEVTIDLSKGNKFKVTLNSGTLFTFTNPPPAGKVMAFSLEISDATVYNLEWGNSVRWEANSVPVHTAGKSLYAFLATSDGVYYGRKVGNNLS